MIMLPKQCIFIIAELIKPRVKKDDQTVKLNTQYVIDNKLGDDMMYRSSQMTQETEAKIY